MGPLSPLRRSAPVYHANAFGIGFEVSHIDTSTLRGSFDIGRWLRRATQRRNAHW